MANNYVTISNTGAIGGGLKMYVEGKTWKESNPAPPEVFTGLDGTSTRSVGAAIAKKRWEFSGIIQKVGATGYVSLDGAGQTAYEWATTTTYSKTLLKMTDVWGTTYDVLSQTVWAPEPVTDGRAGNNEYYRQKWVLVQQ